MSYKEVLVLVVILAFYLFGNYSSYSNMKEQFKELTGYDHVELRKMKEDCEKSLPRDKFCTIKLEVKPDEQP